jgi:hypothetical protein
MLAIGLIFATLIVLFLSEEVSGGRVNYLAISLALL